jgi:heme uptake protein IsdC
VKTCWRLQSVLITALCMLTLFIPPKAEAAALSDGTYTVNYTITKAENESVSMANDYFEKPATVFVNNGQVEMQLAINHSKWVTQFKVPSNTNFTDAKIVSSDSDADKRVVRFQVDDLSKPIISKIHVTVESIDYDHDYTIRFIVDEKSLKNAVSSSTAAPKTEAPAPSEPAATPRSTAAAAAPNASSAQAASASKPAASAPKSTAVQASAAEVKAATAATGDQTASGSSSLTANRQIANPQTGDTAPVLLLTVLLALSGIYLGCAVKARKSGL